MGLHGKQPEKQRRPIVGEASPIFARAGTAGDLPHLSLPQNAMMPDTAAQMIDDELMLDGNARLNLATFVTTWMEPQAQQLMAETFDKNMIDKDEYPRTAEHRDALRQHAEPAVELARPRRGDRARRRPVRARPRCSPGWR